MATLTIILYQKIFRVFMNFIIIIIVVLLLTGMPGLHP